MAYLSAAAHVVYDVPDGAAAAHMEDGAEWIDLCVHVDHLKDTSEASEKVSAESSDKLVKDLEFLFTICFPFSKEAPRTLFISTRRSQKPSEISV